MVVIEFAMSMGLDKEDRMSMPRVKGKLGVIFLSDMTTADERHLKIFACEPAEEGMPQATVQVYISKRGPNPLRLEG